MLIRLLEAYKRQHLIFPPPPLPITTTTAAATTAAGGASSSSSSSASYPTVEETGLLFVQAFKSVQREDLASAVVEEWEKLNNTPLHPRS